MKTKNSYLHLIKSAFADFARNKTIPAIPSLKGNCLEAGYTDRDCKGIVCCDRIFTKSV